MRRAATVLATVFPLLLAQPVASAAPEAKLCTSDVSRGAVPDTFVLDACVDGSNVVLHNKLDVPVTVAVTGDAKAPAGAHPYDSPSTAALRVATAPDTVLLPGDVVRWPLGAGGSELTVAAPGPSATPVIAATLGDMLSRQTNADPQHAYVAMGALIRETATALETRGSCKSGKNFLRTAGCDVSAAAAIGHAAADTLPRPIDSDVLARVLDPDQWARWSKAGAADAAAVSGRELRLVQTSVAFAAVPPALLPRTITALRPRAGAASRPTGQARHSRPVPSLGGVVPARVPAPASSSAVAPNPRPSQGSSSQPGPDPSPSSEPSPSPSPTPDPGPSPTPDPGPS